MLSPILTRHARAVLRALDNHKWERTEDGGLYIAPEKLTFHGLYEHNVNGLDTQYDKNLITTEGMNFFLNVALYTTSKISAWYLALYSGAVTPDNTWNASNFASNGTEITSSSTGYSDSTRVLWTPAGVASGASINNTGALSAFHIAVASGSLTVNGAGLASASAKGATSGTLASAARFGSARSLSDGDVFNLGYTVAATSS